MAVERGRGVEGLAACAHMDLHRTSRACGSWCCLRGRGYMPACREWCAPGHMHTRDVKAAIANVGLVIVVWWCTMCVVLNERSGALSLF